MEPKVIARNNARLDFELHENHPLRLRHARGRKIEALNGTLWITAYNEWPTSNSCPARNSSCRPIA